MRSGSFEAGAVEVLHGAGAPVANFNTIEDAKTPSLVVNHSNRVIIMLKLHN